MHGRKLQRGLCQVSWRAALLRGTASLPFVLVTLLVPGLFLMAMVLAFGIYALTDGASAVSAALHEDSPAAHRDERSAGPVYRGAETVGLSWSNAKLVGSSSSAAAGAVLIGARKIAAVLGLVLVGLCAAGARTLGLCAGLCALVVGSALMGLGWRLRDGGDLGAARVQRSPHG